MKLLLAVTLFLSFLATGLSLTAVANENGSTFLRAGSRRTEETCESIKKIICAIKNTKTFCDMVSMVEKRNFELNDKLLGGTSFTVFAPTNEAFENVTAQLDELSDKEIDELIMFHFNENTVKTYDDLECTSRIYSLTGSPSRTKCRRKSPGVYTKYQRGDGNLELDQFPKIDIKTKEACDGIIHRVDQVLLPKLYKPFKELKPDTIAAPQLAPDDDEGIIMGGDDEVEEPEESEEEPEEEPTDPPTETTSVEDSDLPEETEDNTDLVPDEESEDSTDLVTPGDGTTIEIEAGVNDGAEEEKKPRIGALGINLIIFSTLLLCFVFVCMRR